MSGFLETMASRSRERFAAARRDRPVEDLHHAVHAGPPPRRLRGFGESFDLIAEIKPRSPAEGKLPVGDLGASAMGYETGGAAVISVLTEPTEFGGSLAILREVTGKASVPVMAKDFIVDPYQVYQARDAGADGVLVVARILDDASMTAVLDAAGSVGMFALLEAFDGDDLERISVAAVGRPDVLIGVNCRDLDTLDIVPQRHEQLAEGLPEGTVAVAESAMTVPADIERVAGLGYRAALVGSALMKADDASGLVGEMIDAGRRAMSVAR